MTNQTINSSKKQKQRDPNLVAAEIAMKRAAQRARERAKRIGVGVMVLKNGRIVEEN
jgi:LDH2 family malate/lactate/ureidoglycolate dehydrogenase